MKLLPTTTELPTTPIARRHRPSAGTFPTYRPCLRWEFGFSCAFCLLHEADLVAGGVGGIEGTGLTSVEHQIPRSHAPHLEHEYGNCFYACRWCNGARGDTPNSDATGRTLLEPCSVAWASRFERQGFLLRPLDPDADYTWQTYALDDLRKLELRRARAEAIADGLRILRDGPERVRQLLLMLEDVPAHHRGIILDSAEGLQRQIVAAQRTLSRFRVVPLDADERCRCGAGVEREPPLYLAEQAIELPVP